ncbi:YdcF family protein [Niveispirillum sp.]|uniref:YdcF family protein n=1 Tax=Niveispirillum sp. TaxID=1917217 RepID=UPI001B5D83E9|nr:YdcF family protein [Niveispirillum sp.]MBP7336101.1 YdcF family protein [Niveispirillum sp.]
MGFGLGKLLAAVTSPGNVLLLLLLGGLGLMWRRRPAGRWLVLSATTGFALIAATPVGTWALLPLEQRFPMPDPASMERIDGIIVLGGAVMPVGSTEHVAPQLNRDAERLTVLPGLMRRFPTVPVIFTGGSGDPRRQEEKEAPFALALLAEWGVELARVRTEDQSRNTWENAVNIRPLIAATGGRWLLVTSAAHMPRSMGVFRKAIPEAAFIAYPVGFNANRSERWRFGLNLSDNLERLETAAHEWRGLIAYRMADRIDALFPAP